LKPNFETEMKQMIVDVFDNFEIDEVKDDNRAGSRYLVNPQDKPHNSGSMHRKPAINDSVLHEEPDKDEPAEDVSDKPNSGAQF